ncbi:unnamed protein product [Pieris macdunnoughi]|uniref:Uncharacterized protein n=1 Tax=Pieris macdunnoughi TaxID=345717 RepID=A0A821TG04_9NEOP|nr:unnamed protein product [Pieris macdunnoughi]
MVWIRNLFRSGSVSRAEGTVCGSSILNVAFYWVNSIITVRGGREMCIGLPMMACSYLSATSFKPEPSASSWTPPRGEPGQSAFRLEPETDMEPALDLTTSLKPKPPIDDSE